MKTLNTKLSETTGTWLRSATRLFVLPAIVTLMAVAAQAQVTYTPVFSNVWVVAAGTYLDLPQNTANNSRGVGLNPVRTNVLYGSTANNTNGGAGHVSVLSFASGSNYLAQLPGTNVTSTAAIISLQGVRVADDGAVYACNRADTSSSVFRIYRWASDSDLSSGPSNVFISSPNFIQRMGDHMDVRGGGINTEIVVVGSSGSGANINTNFTIFRPTDASCTVFTNFSITLPGSSATVSVCQYGVTFEGTNSAIWVRSASGAANETRRIVYNPATLTATCARTNAVDQTACRSIKYYADTNGVELLASVQVSATLSAAQIARVFRIPTSPTAALISVLSSNFPAPFTGSQNGNGLGQVDAKKGYFVFGAPGFGLTFFKVDYTTTAPPTVSASSSGTPVIAGYPVTLTATVSGSSPLSYQWYFNTNTPISGATTNFYTIASTVTTNAGVYTLITTNLYGKATNSLTIIVLPNGSSALMTNLWTITDGSRSYLPGSGSLTTRGLGYDPVLNRLVVVGRTPTNGVWLLDANTGAEVGSLDLSLLNPGTPSSGYGLFPINMCGVADDGIVYVANLCISASQPFLIYSFASATDGAAVGTAYTEAAGTLFASAGRLGDNMAVRGAGTNTQIICCSRNTGTNVVIFTTIDGTTFTPNIVAINTVNQEIGGSSVYWGSGNTFWAKTDSLNNIRQVSFDLNTLTGTVIGSYPLLNTEAIIGVDSDNGYVTAVGGRENPQSLGVYDINNIDATLPIDREFFAGSTTGANVQGTGQTVVSVKSGRVFSLSTGTGILAVGYAGKVAISQLANQPVVTWVTSASTLQSTTNLSTTPFADVPSATSPYTNTTDNVKFFRLKK